MSNKTYPLRAENHIGEAGKEAEKWYKELVLAKEDPELIQRLQNQRNILAWSNFGFVFIALHAISALQGEFAKGMVYGLFFVILAFIAPTILNKKLVVFPACNVTAQSILCVAFLTDVVSKDALMPFLVGALGYFFAQWMTLKNWQSTTLPIFSIFSLAASLFTPATAWATTGIFFIASLLTIAVSSWRQGGILSVAPIRSAEEWAGVKYIPPRKIVAPLWVQKKLSASENSSEHDSELYIKRVGRDGERYTALLLLGLDRGAGFSWVHDVVVPGAGSVANADHVVVSRGGGFVLDSKLYGKGRVYVDARGEVFFESAQGVRRSMSQELRNVSWSVRGLRGLTGFNGFAGVVVVHRAKVEGRIRVNVDGAYVDVISADHLTGYLSDATPFMGVGLAEALGELVSSVTFSASKQGVHPSIVRPVGGGEAVHGWVEPAEFPFTSVQVQSAVKRAADSGRSVSRFERWLLSVASTPVGLYEGESLADYPARKIRERWVQMRVAPAAALDDVPAQFRGLRRGVPVKIVSIADDLSSVQSSDAVCMSVPCMGAEEPYVWVASVDGWKRFRENDAPVWVRSVRLDDLSTVDTEF